MRKTIYFCVFLFPFLYACSEEKSVEQDVSKEKLTSVKVIDGVEYYELDTIIYLNNVNISDSILGLELMGRINNGKSDKLEANGNMNDLAGLRTKVSYESSSFEIQGMLVRLVEINDEILNINNLTVGDQFNELTKKLNLNITYNDTINFVNGEDEKLKFIFSEEEINYISFERKNK